MLAPAVYAIGRAALAHDNAHVWENCWMHSSQPQASSDAVLLGMIKAGEYGQGQGQDEHQAATPAVAA
jgi:hypothetical protein